MTAASAYAVHHTSEPASPGSLSIRASSAPIAISTCDGCATPAEQAELEDEIRKHLAALPETNRRTIEFGLGGYGDEEIHEETGVAVHRVRLILREFIQDLMAARELQQSLLGVPGSFPGLDISARNDPAIAASGDTYDFLPVVDSLW